MADSIVIVAEAAQGFEGDGTLATLLVRAAARASADLIKFQLVYADELATSSYQYYELFRRLEMPDEVWQGVAETARHEGIALAFDVYGPRSLALALQLGSRVVKIHATDFFNDALIDAAFRDAPAVHVSAGGITFAEIAAFVERHRAHRAKLVLLGGFQAEPTELLDTNLARLADLRRQLPDVALGFMDHAAGDTDPASWLGVLAVPYGVQVIEKHLTLERGLSLEDSVSALSSPELAAYIRRIRAAEQAIGPGGLALTDREVAYRRRAVKTVVAMRSLRAGERVTDADIGLRRTAVVDGVEVIYRLSEASGRRLRHDIAGGCAIGTMDLE